MILKHGGTVDHGRFNVRRTRDDMWQVSTKTTLSKFGTVIGEVDTLAEVDSLIERHLDKVRVRLAKAQAIITERQAVVVSP